VWLVSRGVTTDGRELVVGLPGVVCACQGGIKSNPGARSPRDRLRPVFVADDKDDSRTP